MNTHTEIARITEELRALCHTDNDAPRLIAEMLEREFPDSLDLASRIYTDRIEELEEEDVDVDRMKIEIRELEDTVDKLEAEIEKLESALHGE